MTRFVSDHWDRLQTYWSRALDKFRARAVNEINKQEYYDLLERVIEGKGVYAKAHFKTLTAENVKIAFKKTGVIPVNRDVVTSEMMAPSLESSSRGTLPVQQSSPVKVTRTEEEPALASTSPPSAPSTPSMTLFFARAAVDNPSAASASFLTSLTSPSKSTSLPPSFKPFTISPLKQTARYPELLERPPATAREQELVDVLRDYEHHDMERKKAMIAMQAGVVLAGMYTDRAHSQLQAQEEKKARKNGRRKMGDGKAKYFMGDEFIQLCIEDERLKEQGAVEKEGRRVQREAHAEELVSWKKTNDQIRERNEARKAQFEADKAVWEVEKKAEAKAEKRRPGWLKPKWIDYGPEKQMARPKKPVDDEDEEEEDGEGSGNESGMDID
ncbi:hypothetical protein B0H11DRAFT_2206972 [Mycena galericulata]|nr:hypothetical protein B0H11DRAFT_2206972 [Mycena galericulata]